jgi:amino acid adenylation domain-containing protein
MKAVEIISKLRECGVVPKLVEGSLRLSGKTNELSSEFLAELKEHKHVLIEFLQELKSNAEQEIEIVENKDSYEVTNAQQRIWVLSQFEGGSEAYNISDSFYIQGELNIELFEKSFQLSVEKHESLRTYFVEEKGGLFQKISDNLVFQLDVLEEKSYSIKEIKDQQKKFVTETFVLTEAPLFKVKLIPLADKEFIMMFNMHHIIGDGWSLGILLQEVMANYKSLCLNEEISNTESKIQFKDYSEWLKKKINGEFGEKSRLFWKEKNLSEIEGINLPIDFPRPEVNSFDGATQKFYFTPEFYNDLNNLAKKRQTTLFNIYRSVLNILLHKWTNQNEIVVGTPVAGRSHYQLADQIGLFVNTLPLVSSYDGSKSIAELVKDVSTDSLDTFKYQDYPLDLLIEENNIKRDSGRSPLFDVMIVVQNTSLGDGTIEFKNQHGFTLTGINEFYNEEHETERVNIPAKFDLSFYFAVDTDNNPYIEIEYKTRLFKKSTVQAFYKMFEYIVKQIVSNDDIILSEIEIVNPEDKNRILNEFNTPIKTYSESSILDLILPSIESNGDKVGVLDDVNALSYSDLDKESDSIAHIVSKSNTSKVGLFLSRTTKIVSSVIGVWKTGKAYVPIDNKYPAGRIEYIIEDSKIEILIVDNESIKHLPESFAGTCINVDEIDQENQKYISNHQSNENDIAYLIYTSGSTGQPKGVEIMHKNAIAFLKWCSIEFSETPYDVMYAGTSYCFDLSVFEMLLPLYQGKKIRVLESGATIPNHIHTDKNIFINTVPSVVRSLIDQNIDWSNVKAINLAGEPVPKIFKDILDYSTIEIRNLYGPSEDTTYSTFYRFADDKLDYIPIGIPVGDTHLYILDSDLKILPIGVEGEICLSGASIAKGYLNKEELTLENFVEHPFVPGQTLYRTGDIGKWTEHGHVDFVGRMDDQVKVRGFRIELGEIQYQMDCITEMEQAVVIVEDINEEKTILAYYKTSSAISKDQIKEKLVVNLPLYMIPTHFIELDEIPMNSNGKVDKKMLELPDVSSIKDTILPKTETQERLLKLWEETLNISGFGIEANFFELGGHSLKATKLRSLILSEFEKEITLNELFQHPNIPEIAELIESRAIHKENKIEKLVEATDEPLALSYAQERLWVLTKFENASKAYHMPAAFEVEGELNTSVLEEAILNVIDRHESLRTLFKEKNGSPYQLIVSAQELNFKITEISLEKEDIVEDYLQNSWGNAFDLENGPLLRCELIKSDNNLILSFNMHHIISDGWSIGVLFSDVIQSYSQLLNDESGQLPELNIQYKDFSNWQKQQLTDEALDQQLSYWKNEVFDKELTNLELPYDALRPEIKTFNGDTCNRVLSKSLSDKIKAQATELGVSTFMSLFANVDVLLKKLSNQSDITIGTPVSGRDSSQLQQQIGFYVNTLPIRSNVIGQNSFESLVIEVRENLLEAFNYQHFPFEMLVEEVQPKRDLSRSPLFDVMIVMQNFDILEKDNLHLNESVQFKKIETSSGNTKYDLTFSFVEGEKGIQLELEYNKDLFKASSVNRMIDQLERVLDQTTVNGGILIEDILIVSAEESNELLKKSDMTHITYDKSQSIVSHFDKVVKQFPDKIALKVEGKSLTYQELDIKSGQLAKYLVDQHNVKDEDLVILHTDRSEWMIISILACLKSGAVYVPVDPTYPSSRIKYILEDSGSQLILTDETIENEEINAFEDKVIVNVAEVTYDGETFKKEIKPSQLAYIIYTSGTTGNPKGVLIEHGNVSRLLFNDSDYFDFDENDTWTLFHSYCFDFSVWEMYGALLKGGTLVMVPKVIAQDSEVFFNFLTEEKITVLNQTPTAFRSLCLTNEKRFTETALDVRYVIFGGEALNPSSLKEWNTYYQNCKLINMYGITETTVHVTYKEITAKEIEENKSNIGVPIPTLSCYVLDNDMKPCAPGVIGELVIGGAGVARGYHNRPDLTSEKFVPSPFAQNENLYRSGDFARLLVNGDIEYIGRKDEQVKVRGHRIELGEVEEALKTLLIINDAVVMAEKNSANQFELIAYYILEDENNSEVNLRQSLVDGLPSYMIPSHYISLSEFPMTSNGKLDKEALPSVSESSAPALVYVAPENEIQEKIVAIWIEVLDKENIGIKDNFFDLGGHSLKATRVISKIQELYGIKIDLGTLFIDPTVEHLSKYVETMLWMESQDGGIEEEEEEEEEMIL